MSSVYGKNRIVSRTRQTAGGKNENISKKFQTAPFWGLALSPSCKLFVICIIFIYVIIMNVIYNISGPAGSD